SSGRVGGSVLQAPLKHHSAAEAEFTVLVRSEEKERKLEELADADNLPAIKAVLAGMKRRYGQTGKAPILVHTSGTAVLMDNAEGKYEGTKYYDDTVPEQFDTLAETQIHRNVDLLVVEADKEGYIKSHIVLPSGIYGIASGPLFDAGIGNRHTIAIPLLIKIGVGRGAAGVINEGLNKCPCVHIDDIADLYVTVYDGALSGRAGHGREGYYFGENGHYSCYDLSKAVAEVLVALGKSKNAEPSPFTKEECEQMPLLLLLGANSLCHANRARALGWNPKYTVEDLFKSVKPEAEAILA
ncbi:hypothetical protein CONPUDRAFT_50446, partial [Coniophora puteana RWD-64-598 SS2]